MLGVLSRAPLQFARALHRSVPRGRHDDPEKRGVMKDFFVFGMGFASGWAARMGVGSSFRESAVDLIAAGYRGAERVRVRIETEREFLQDLLAEGRAQYETGRKHTASTSGPTTSTPAQGEPAPAQDAARFRAA